MVLMRFLSSCAAQLAGTLFRTKRYHQHPTQPRLVYSALVGRECGRIPQSSGCRLTSGTNEGFMCGFRPSSSSLAAWLSRTTNAPLIRPARNDLAIRVTDRWVGDRPTDTPLKINKNEPPLALFWTACGAAYREILLQSGSI